MCARPVPHIIWPRVLQMQKMGRGRLALGSCVQQEGRKRAAGKRIPAKFTSSACRSSRCVVVGPWLPAFLQLCSWRQQLEEEPFCGDMALLHIGVCFPLSFSSVNVLFLSRGADYYLAETYFLLKSGFVLCLFPPAPPFAQTSLFGTDLDWGSRSLQSFFRLVTRVSSALYVFLCPFHHIFSSNLEICKE